MLHSFQRLELYYPAPRTHDRECRLTNFTMKSIELTHTNRTQTNIERLKIYTNPTTTTFPQTFLI